MSCLRGDNAVSEGRGTVSTPVLLAQLLRERGSQLGDWSGGMTQLHLNSKGTGALRPELSNSQPNQLCKNRTSTLNSPSAVDRHPPPVVPAENLTPSYSLPATSWRFLLHSKWGGSDQLSPPCLKQKGWSRSADPLWLGKPSQVVSERLGKEMYCISSKRGLL